MTLHYMSITVHEPIFMYSCTMNELCSLLTNIYNQHHTTTTTIDCNNVYLRNNSNSSNNDALVRVTDDVVMNWPDELMFTCKMETTSSDDNSSCCCAYLTSVGMFNE